VKEKHWNKYGYVCDNHKSYQELAFNRDLR
jgi:hypothetical protein